MGKDITIDRNVMLAFVVVLLAMSVAVSGYLILKTLESVNGGDPFEEEHHYSVVGTMTVDGETVECTGYSDSHYASETEIFEIFTFKTYYGKNDTSHFVRSQIMFDSDRNPVSFKYTYEGMDESGNELWSYIEEGVKTIFTLNKTKVIISLEITSETAHLIATMA